MKVSRRNKLPHSMKPCTGGCMNFTSNELSEQLLPRCTCGANTYCRCE